MTEDYNQGLNSMADIISNLLGILTVVFLVTTLTIGLLEQTPNQVDPEKQASIEFKTPKRAWFPAWEKYFLIVKGRIIYLDLNQASDIFMQEGSNAREIKTAIGTYTLFDNEYHSDVNVYSLKCEVNWDAAFKNNASADDKKCNAFLNAAEQRSRKMRGIAIFLVYPTGMKLFSKIHRELLKRRIRFKFYTILPSHPLIFTHNRDDFDTEGLYATE